MIKIVLASASPRRREILSQVGFDFEICPSDKEELVTSTAPEEVVLELSMQKAKDIYERYQEEDVLIIAADTIVAKDDKILGKPRDKEDAIEMLKLIQGSSHKVYTGVTLMLRKEDGCITKSFYEATKVNVFPMTMDNILEYIDSKEPFDKAGAYAIQGLFAAYIESIEGDYYNVVGLPIGRLCSKLRELNI
ncbi:MAG: septum formation protein Maf [Lachnospira sp.]|nr:septum formation protein Maf [Lachnospira sp.]